MISESLWFLPLLQGWLFFVLFVCFMKLYFASSVKFASIFIEGAIVADV